MLSISSSQLPETVLNSTTEMLFFLFLKFKNEEIFVNSFDLQGVSWILNLKWLFMCTSGLLYDWITHILSISLPSRKASSLYH